ncbi:MAG: septation regulator SpoVG [bacterium]
MEITEVKVTLVSQEQLKAYVTLVLDECFVVRDVKVIHGPKGYFVAMPSKKRKDGTFRDIAHPINRETREKLEQAVLRAYEEASGEHIEEVRNLEERESDSESQELSV